jgi:endothelin-converting enzyme/putative endopeptidase
MSRHFLPIAAAALAACATSPTAKEEGAAAGAFPLTGGVDEKLLDKAAKPCDDFFQYACGGWVKSVEIPADKPRFGSFDALFDKNLEVLKKLAEDAAAGKEATGSYSKKVGDFYAACMDEAAIEKRGLGDLAPELARIDGLKDAAGLAPVLARLHAVGAEPFFELISEPDAKDATKMIGWIIQSGLGMPDRDFYFRDDPQSKQLRGLYEGHVGRMLGLAGAPAAETAKQAKAVLAFETRLAESHWTRVEMRDPDRRYNRLDLAGVEKRAPHFDWKAYLAAAGRHDATALSVTTPKNLDRFEEIVKSGSLPDLKVYLRWQLVSHLAPSLTKAFVDESFSFQKLLSGQKELSPRWKRCVMATDHGLGEAIGQGFVKQTFGADGKKRSLAIVTAIEASMEQDLTALPWMDAPTREKAFQKLHKMGNMIGYPDAWRSYDALAISRESHAKNAMAATAFEHQRKLGQIGKPSDRGEWHMTPATVNAYYTGEMNQMVFPAGILQPPFFDRTAGMAKNFGSIGFVAGHELTHGFDDQGRKYDADGNLKMWWSPDINKEFERRAECVVKQFDRYEPLPGSHVNGKLTLGENIADLGGLKLAYAALQAEKARRGPGAAVEKSKEGLDADQEFWIGAAQDWCTKARDEYLRLQVQTDPHSWSKFRVNGPLSNLPEFSKTWQCKAGDPMARSEAERCQVW